MSGELTVSGQREFSPTGLNGDQPHFSTFSRGVEGTYAMCITALTGPEANLMFESTCEYATPDHKLAWQARALHRGHPNSGHLSGREIPDLTLPRYGCFRSLRCSSNL